MRIIEAKIRIEYGSEYQKDFSIDMLKGLMIATKTYLENSHKKNKVAYKIKEIDEIENINLYEN